MVSGLELKSLIGADGTLRLSLEDRALPDPGPGEVVIRVEGAPINPTDHFQMTGPADLSTLQREGSADRPVLTAKVHDAALASVKQRLDQPRPVGSEGAGTVVAAGAEARALLGKRVAVNAGGMYAQYRLLPASACLVLPDDVTSAEGAAVFINPLTALAFVETMRMEGFTGLVHAAAASNLGQMLVKLCRAEAIPLVNIVRRDEQVALLKGLGATQIVNSSSPSFEADLAHAVAETSAYLAFDPTGGGKLASQILGAMEAAAAAASTSYQVYGTSVPKKVYIYGGLERGPTLLERRYGFAWDVGGWLLFPFMQKIGPESAARLRQHVLRDIKTIFASSYSRTIGLREMLDPEIFRAYTARATGEKMLVDPTRDGPA